MVRKGAIVTYIWSFHENFENYRKLVLPQGGTCHVFIRGCACHVLGLAISLESHIFGSKIFKYECPIFWG